MIDLTPYQARLALGCIYDRRAALADHLFRAVEREAAELEQQMVRQRLRDLDGLIAQLRNGWPS